MVEVGQIIYVSTRNYYGGEARLEERTVTKVNRSSFYAPRNGSSYEERFSQKTMRSSGYGSNLKAYLIAEEFWGYLREQEEHDELLKEIHKEIHRMDTEKLKKLKAYMTSL